MSGIILYGHRGGGDPWPDSSLESYTWGANWGADFLEPDLYLTKDGVLVVSHDNISQGFANVTYAAALAMNPALLTFGQVIELVKRFSLETGRDIGIIPELKDQSQAAAVVLVQTLIKHDFTDHDRVVVQSFGSTNLRWLHDTIMPQYGVDFQLAYLGIGITNPALIATFADIVAPSLGSFSAADVQAAHSAGLKVVAWTIAGAQSDIQKLVNLGVDGVFVDNVLLARPGEANIQGLKVTYGTPQGDAVSDTTGNDEIYGMQGDDIIRAGAGTDVLYGDAGNDMLFGGDGDDTLTGGSGTDYLNGGAGKDVLAGSTGNDVIEATGDEVLFRPGDGIDLVVADNASRVTFTGNKSTEVTVIQDGTYLILRAGVDALVIRDGNDAAHLPGFITFADGVTWTNADLAAHATTGTDVAVEVALLGLESVLTKARALATLSTIAIGTAPVAKPGVPFGTDLIINGSFEDVTGMTVAGNGWGWHSTDGVPGWQDLSAVSGFRSEVHTNVQNGIGPKEGTKYFDLDGNGNNARLVQQLVGVETGAVYKLSFWIGDADGATADDGIKVLWGGQQIYAGAPKNIWQQITIDVVGGSGDRSNKLEFDGTETNPNWYGAALDNISLVKIDKHPNLIVNGSFEDLTGAYNGGSAGDWGYRNDNGIVAGWQQLNTSGGGRAEIHWDSHGGVSAKDGRMWFDMDGIGNNARLVQTVANVETGKSYDLTFSIADQDPTTADDGVRVFWGGQVVYEGLPGQAWQTITRHVVGGAGDGSNKLRFEGTETNTNWYGVALDDVSLCKTTEAPFL